MKITFQSKVINIIKIIDMEASIFTVKILVLEILIIKHI